MRQIFLAAVIGCAALSATADGIDRQAVVQRHNPHITSFDTLSSLTVGNGRFAFTVDPTGLQSFASEYAGGVPLCTMSEWGWHSFPNVDSLRPEESRALVQTRPDDVPRVYAVEVKQEGRGKAATEYFRVNPHRLNLATISLNILSPGGGVISDAGAFTDIDQTLDLWDGEIRSSYRVLQQPVHVSTAVLPDRDCVVASITSPLVARDRLAVAFQFPYPTGIHSDNASSYTPTDKGALQVIEKKHHSALVRRTIGSSDYYLYLQWENGTMAEIDTKNELIWLMGPGSDTLSFAAEFSASIPAAWTYTGYADCARRVSDWWHRWWQEGAIVDFGECTDPRAPELERRVVLSQYLTQVNCAGSLPPQETGLTYNSWFGRPHLEMAWWHGVDFALWGRPEVLERWMHWYDSISPEARSLAQRQGFKGLRWLKMTDPDGGEAPSNVGSFLIWQQPHYIYFAEELYRADPTDETLAKYADLVEETAEFMADFALVGSVPGRPIQLSGYTAMQESMSKDLACKQPFEVAYWVYGLETAQTWRERRGLPRDARWDDVLSRIDRRLLGRNTDAGTIYSAGGHTAQGAMDPDLFDEKSRSDHPAVLGACGLLPDTKCCHPQTMSRTYDWVLDNWHWETTWGWDYGMVAMAAARLGRPADAVDALLMDVQKNTYLPSGHNYQEPRRLRIYLPGNGALLTAVAMMCAGWDGSEGDNPGFPDDGTWRVRWEGLKPMQ